MSGHGYGHAVRTAQVLRAIRRLRPEVPLAMVTSADEEVCRRAAGEPLLFRRARVDTGLAQKDALRIDEEGTAAAWEAFQAKYPRRVAEEAAWLHANGAVAVIADVPPLAFDAAAEAGIPSFGLANFSWDWIWRHFAPRVPRLAEAADQAARAYGRATLLLELPFAGDLRAFPRRERIPLVARHPARSGAEVRRAVGLGEADAVVLLSFGGIGLPGFDPAVLAPLRAFRFLVTDGRGPFPDNTLALHLGALAAQGIDYADVVGAADVVVTKPGYGIVADAIAGRTRMVYTERGDFPEYPILVCEMARWLPAAHVSNADLLGGALGPALAEVLPCAFPEAPRLDGAEVAAALLVGTAART